MGKWNAGGRGGREVQRTLPLSAGFLWRIQLIKFLVVAFVDPGFAMKSNGIYRVLSLFFFSWAGCCAIEAAADAKNNEPI